MGQTPSLPGKGAGGLGFPNYPIDDELDGEDVIPGFKLKVKRLFELPNIGQPDDFN